MWRRKQDERSSPRWLLRLVLCTTCLASGCQQPAAIRPGLPKTYTTNFPIAENPVFEGGKWSNGRTDGLDWFNVATQPGLAYGTQLGGGGFDDSTAILTGSWGPTQTVQATVHSINQSPDDSVVVGCEILSAPIGLRDTRSISGAPRPAIPTLKSCDGMVHWGTSHISTTRAEAHMELPMATS